MCKIFSFFSRYLCKLLGNNKNLGMQRHLVMSLVGARPQFMKLAPLARILGNERFSGIFSHFILHTGQHYDHGMSEVFFEELHIPSPDINLGVGSGSHGQQTGEMLKQIEAVLMEHRPRMLVIFGDTNSTLAGALAAAKLHIPIAHVEAGLRSFNRAMPEEINRIVSDHTADILLAPTPTAMDNLATEGLADRSICTGDIMYDAVLHYGQLPPVPTSPVLALPLTSQQYYLATVHRPSNTDDPQKLQHILEAFNHISQHHHPVLFPMHPRTRNRIQQHLPHWNPAPRLHITEPLGYLDMLYAMRNSRLVFTDSGGLQKEAFFLERPCITLRPQTEWVETIEAGANVLCPSQKMPILSMLDTWEHRISSENLAFKAAVQEAYGKGNAAEQTVEAIAQFLEIKEVIQEK